MQVRSWEQLVHDPVAPRHVVQFYRDPTYLRRVVGAWLWQALGRGGGAAVIATAEHAVLFREELREEGLDPAVLERIGRLRIVDADATLALFMRDGTPDRERFKRAVRTLLAGVRASCGGAGEVRAWGEMVDMLRKRGNLAAAQRLEDLWNEVIAEEGLRLLCSYEVDVLASETYPSLVGDLCHGHSHLLPQDDAPQTLVALARASADVLGAPVAETLRVDVEQRVASTALPPETAFLQALHGADPQAARKVLAAARILLGRDASA